MPFILRCVSLSISSLARVVGLVSAKFHNNEKCATLSWQLMNDNQDAKKSNKTVKKRLICGIEQQESRTVCYCMIVICKPISHLVSFIGNSLKKMFKKGNYWNNKSCLLENQYAFRSYVYVLKYFQRPYLVAFSCLPEFFFNDTHFQRSVHSTLLYVFYSYTHFWICTFFSIKNVTN